MANLLSTDQTDICYVKEEATYGTLITPAGTDVFRLISEAGGGQDPTIFESMERFPSRSILEELIGRNGPGEYSFEGYWKRTGTVDTAVPSIDTLMTCGLGIKATNAGTNITHTLAKLDTVLKTFSMFYRTGYMTFQRAGCVLNDMTWPFQATADESTMFRGTMAGFFSREYWAGYTVSTEALATTDAGLTMVKVAAADLAPSDHATAAVAIAGKFTIGAYIMVGALTTAHKITDINPTTGVITVTPAFGSDQAIGSVVKGYIPAATDAGSPISGHKGWVVYDGANQPVLSGTIHVNNGLTLNNDVKTDSDWPDPTPQPLAHRQVSIDGVRMLFNPTPTVGKATDLFKSIAHLLDANAGAIHIGRDAGYIWDFGFPELYVRNPRTGSDGGRKILECDLVARATASLDDEMNVESR